MPADDMDSDTNTNAYDSAVSPGLEASDNSDSDDGFDYQEGSASLDATEPTVQETSGNSGSVNGSGMSSEQPAGTGSGTLNVPENSDVENNGQSDLMGNVGRATGGDTSSDTSNSAALTAPSVSDNGVNAATDNQPGNTGSTVTTGSGLVNVRPVATTTGSTKQPPIIPAKHYSSSPTRRSAPIPRSSAETGKAVNRSAVPNPKFKQPVLPNLPKTPSTGTGEYASAPARVTNFNNVPD